MMLRFQGGHLYRKGAIFYKTILITPTHLPMKERIKFQQPDMSFPYFYVHLIFKGTWPLPNPTNPKQPTAAKSL